jgi:predicted transport protein
MADIKLFRTTGTVAELPASAVMLERELQTLIEKNMLTFFGITFLQSEYVIPEGRMDSLGIDENNCPVIFEYKRSISENVINQGLFYLDWLLDHKANFKLLVIEKCGMERANQIDWSVPCVLCVANDFTKYDVHAVNQMQRNIQLVRYRKFGDDLLFFEYLNTPSVSSPASLKQSAPPKATEGIVEKPEGTPVIKPGADKSFIDYLDSASQDQRDLYYSIRDYIFSLGDDISESQLKHYVAFRKSRNFATVEVNAKLIYINLSLNPDDYKDRLTKGFLRDMRNTGHWGTGDLRVIIRNIEDFDKAKDIIQKSHEVN